MGTEKIYTLIFNNKYSGQPIDYRHVDGEILIAIDSLTHEEVKLYYNESIFLNEDGEELFSASELMKFDTFKNVNSCEECNGDGYVDIYIECGKPASQCCGGCTTPIECECKLPYPL